MRTPVVAIECDLCQYGGGFTQPEDFQTFGSVDLCKWCADATSKAWTETGGHRVTFNGTEGWSCDCGMDSTQWPIRSLTILTAPRIVAAVPSLDNATAHLHLEGRLGVTKAPA